MAHFVKISVSVTLLMLVVFCTRFENPFSDPSNAKLYILKTATTFNTEKTDTVAIFKSETLTVATTVCESVDSFSVSADHNRLWKFQTILHPTSENYHFAISFYDTGLQRITITTFRNNNDKQIQNINVYAKNPFSPGNIPPSNYADSILVTSGATGDKGITYNWLFGTGGEQIQSYYPSGKARVTYTNNLENKGSFWVSDSAYSSPILPFTYSFFDSTPPVILCVNDNFDQNTNTITTSDTVFSFRVRVTDRGNESVDKVTINGNAAAFEKMNVYTSIFKNISSHTKTNPLKIAVEAIDSYEFGNDTSVNFNVIFDKNAKAQGTTTISISSMSGASISTGRNLFNIFGTVENTVTESIILHSFLNNIPLSDTIIFTSGNWSSLLTLKEGQNTFSIIATDTSNKLLDSQSVKIFYQLNAPDTLPPVIISKGINDHSIDDKIVKEDSVIINLSAFDAGSGIQKIKFENDSIMTTENTYQWDLKIRKLKHNLNIIHLQISDFKGNVRRDSVVVIQNSMPEIISKRTIPYVVYTGTTYYDTIKTIDMDNDSVSISFLKKPSGMSVYNQKYISWTPTLKDTGSTLVIQLRDGIQVSPAEIWEFVVVDPQKMAPAIQISDDLPIPAFLEAEKDTFQCSIATKENTGKRPFLYSAILINRNDTLLNRSKDSSFLWIPKASDTGTVELQLIAEDTLRFADTLFRSIQVVPRNKYPVSLSWKSSSLLPIKDGSCYEIGNDASSILFTIHDEDNPLTEKHLLTIKSAGQSFTTQVKSDTFTLKVTPAINRCLDTITAIINDNTGTADTATIVLLYPISSPNVISDLSNWYTDGSVSIYYGTNRVEYWNDKGNGTLNLYNTSFNNWPDYIVNSINGHGAVNFDNNLDFLVDQNAGNTFFSNPVTVFFVARCDSLASCNYTLLSSSGSDDKSKLTGFGITERGKAGFFTKNSSAGFPSNTIVTNSNLAVTKKAWHIIGFSSTENISNQQLTSVVDIDGQYDTISFTSYQDNDLVLGAGYRSPLTYGWDGQIAEVIIFKRELSDIEKLAVERYLSKKFRL